MTQSLKEDTSKRGEESPPAGSIRLSLCWPGFLLGRVGKEGLPDSSVSLALSHAVLVWTLLDLVSWESSLFRGLLKRFLPFCGQERLRHTGQGSFSAHLFHSPPLASCTVLESFPSSVHLPARRCPVSPSLANVTWQDGLPHRDSPTAFSLVRM